MATRINRKNATVASPKEVVTAEKSVVKTEPGVGPITSKPTAKTPIGKRITKKNQTKRVNKTSVAVKLKAKAKKYPLSKTLLQNAKTADGKKRLLRNVKDGKPRKRKLQKETDDSPPVLEPIFPLEENVETKKQPRTRATKKTVDLLDVTKIKIENEDDISLSSDVTDISNSEIPTLTRQVRKPRAPKKPKVENETLEDVMNDLSFLIKTEEAKEEGESLSESSKSETMSKPKKLTKRQRIELLKKKIIKKENIENTLSKLDSADEKVIDMLDLNVKRVKQKPVTKRRHSIEKFPVGSSEDTEVNQLPFLGSPKTRRIVKPRQSIEGASRRTSPYTTRSDSPARILRNGKQRKAKGHLLEGLDIDVKKRRRLCSDLSGSEISMSKMSGYDSDSSFSDLSSVHGAENNESEVSKTKEDTISVKPTASSETTITATKGPIEHFGIIDTNSNLCDDFSVSNKTIEEDQSLDDPCLPDKDTLLDIMKQAFNDVKKTVKPTQKMDTMVTSKFYGKSTKGKAAGKTQEVVPVVATTQNDESDTISQPETVGTVTAQDLSTVTEHEAMDTEPPNALEPLQPAENLSNTDDSVAKPCETNDTKARDDAVEDDSIAKYDDAVENHVEPDIVTQSEAVLTGARGSSEAMDDQVEAVVTPSQSCVPPDHIPDLPKPEREPEPMQVDDDCMDSEDANLKSEEKEQVEEQLVMDPQSDIKEKKPVDENEYDAPLDEVVRNHVELLDGEVNVEVDNPILENDEVPISAAAEAVQESVTDAINHSPAEAFEDLVIKATEDSVVDQESKASGESAKDKAGESGSDAIEAENNTSDVNVTDDNSYAVMDNSEASVSVNIEESAEELAIKESIFKALGLQSLKAAEEAKRKTIRDRPSCSSWKSDNYTGTLKTVIKINRDKKKGGKSSMKVTLQKSRPKTVVAEEDQSIGEDHRVNKEGSSSISKQGGSHSSDTAGAHRKSHYSNRSNPDGSSEHTSDGETATQDGAIKALVIPEKASSFSIHPGRLCKDECSYCFGKFGLFDTPCHIAQMKSVERQNKILDTEKHLTRDSCLCDACYRHVDRKSNTPSYTNRSFKRNSLVAPGPRQNHCHVLGCGKVAANILRRKWIIKMRKSICQVINIDLDNPGLHSIPICATHYAALDHLMYCAMCRRRLARNTVHYVGAEAADGLSAALAAEGVPIALAGRPVVCKLCKCFAAIVVKEPASRPESSGGFFKEYKKRLLHFNHIVPMDAAAAEEPIAAPGRFDVRADASPKRRRRRADADAAAAEGGRATPGSPADECRGAVDYAALIPAIAMDCSGSDDSESRRDTSGVIDKIEAIRDSVEITKVPKHVGGKLKNGDVAVQKLGSNPSISVRQLFPGEEDVPLHARIDFDDVKETTPEGWEKCSTTIQYDAETKRLWQELQKPYGNQSSFLRHLVLLEKYFRNGDLVLSPRAGHHAINYSESVNNRLRAYDNISQVAAGGSGVQPLSMLQFNKMRRSSSGIITSAHHVAASGSSTVGKPVGNLAMSVTAVPGHAPRGGAPPPAADGPPPPCAAPAPLPPRPRAAATAPPPGLISLHAGGAPRPPPLPAGAVAAGGAPRLPQSQKIKFPITKNWRPNLIPIDPSKKQEKKVGLVQVISGGKPYHITLEDYKKMCAIKRSFEMKQKRLQEAPPPAKPILVTHNSVLKSIVPRKGLVISKAAPPAAATTVKSEPPSSEDNFLERLDRQVERLDSKSLLLPRIPRSLTVIPQTVPRRAASASRPGSPTPRGGS